MAGSTVSQIDVVTLKKMACYLRGVVITLCHESKSAHLGSSLSCLDVLTAAYWHVLKCNPDRPDDPLRDRFILSKGHAAMALYATLANKGYFPLEELKSYNQNGGRLAEHPPANILPGVEAATGSLGHGLPIGNGMAVAGKILKQAYRVYCLMSDGENNEGSVWEAAMFASAHELNNLCVIVDYNKWQATGRSNDTLMLAPLADKWRSFGWDAHEIDGHDVEALAKLMNRLPSVSAKPLAIIAHTVKGKGVSFMEDDNNWHYRAPNSDEVMRAHQELGLI